MLQYMYKLSVSDSRRKKRMQVSLEDPKRFRIELTFSRGADLSPLRVRAKDVFN